MFTISLNTITKIAQIFITCLLHLNPTNYKYHYSFTQQDKYATQSNNDNKLHHRS